MWKSYIAWLLMWCGIIIGLERHPDVSAIIFLAFIASYWLQRIERAILAKKD